MFWLIKQMFIGLLASRVNVFNHTKYVKNVKNSTMHDSTYPY